MWNKLSTDYVHANSINTTLRTFTQSKPVRHLQFYSSLPAYRNNQTGGATAQLECCVMSQTPQLHLELHEWTLDKQIASLVSAAI